MAATTTRIQVPETPDLHAALGIARARWPEEKHTSRLIERLAVEGAQHITVDTPDERAKRFRALVTASPTHFPEGYLESVREGWR